MPRLRVSKRRFLTSKALMPYWKRPSMYTLHCLTIALFLIVFTKVSTIAALRSRQAFSAWYVRIKRPLA
ncbi:Uncharacterised protein [Vibrio cholerae]|uniref:Uncharacterized protein n=1 Tax=Vibrio cholerae TaxID=666 RepID=A0A656AHK5_VIBCL|nr:Uncharacterised protein [Vibrio cholerae]CSA33403.1 Uncharacterised protein [Vibrio cholerae]CSB24033.1 Uncharacterised protein [Vibrio cholerae]CSC28478.1 Uncharacterised protein [Vibrio cholerae]CSC45856.1 Uncharacterised protein [Vibrio cholerae]